MVLVPSARYLSHRKEKRLGDQGAEADTVQATARVKSGPSLW
jgi:hypothetical protein